MKPPIEYRPKPQSQRQRKKGGDASESAVDNPGRSIKKPSTTEVLAGASSGPKLSDLEEFVSRGIAAQDAVNAALEEFKAAERAKVKERVKRHRERKKRGG